MSVRRFFRARNLAALGTVAAFACTTIAAQAGAPLKGVDVKLGKNPGGGCAARSSSTCTAGHNEIVTGADGSANFGILPKGRYDVTVSARKFSIEIAGKGRDSSPALGGSTAQVTIAGTAVPTRACWNLATGQTYDPAARAASSDRITFDADGIHPIIINVVDTAKDAVRPSVANNRTASSSC
jgi:hypothetical protein